MIDPIKITFHPGRVTGRVPRGTTILEAARIFGLNIEGPCNGTGKCSKDLVQVRTSRTLETVLACKTRIDDELEVIIPSHDGTVKVVEDFYVEGSGADEFDPLIKKEVVRDGDLFYTHVYIGNKLYSIEDGDTGANLYGVALDIGTTTLVASLVDLSNPRVLGSSSTLNPLVHYGHDVMSRIRFSASQKDGLARMHRELISAVNLLIHVLCSENRVKEEDIYQLVAAGNTTMQHIFLNRDIRSIGEYPYKAEILDTFTVSAKELAIDMAGSGAATTLPCISAYVGGDIVSGLLAVIHKDMELPAIFLDIGTNGEMALILDNGIVATSTAAGPCFEGMSISSGMRAGAGAIEHVRIGEELTLEVIGGGPARGICGSGLLDLVSELVRTDIVNSRGRLKGRDSEDIPEKYKKYLFEKDGKRQFRLYGDISISQEDIRQVQLAKAAVRSGVEVLLLECGIKAEEIKTAIIAGGFGYHLKADSIFGVGMLPELMNAKLLFVGNSSLGGAVRILHNKKSVFETARIISASRIVDLSQIPAFEPAYIREMHFRLPARLDIVRQEG